MIESTGRGDRVGGSGEPGDVDWSEALHAEVPDDSDRAGASWDAALQALVGHFPLREMTRYRPAMLLDVAVATQRALDALQAIHAVAVAGFTQQRVTEARWVIEDLLSQGSEEADAELKKWDGSEELAVALGLAPGTASRLGDTCIQLTRLRQTLALLAAGRIHWPAAQAIVYETAQVSDPDQLGQIEDLVFAKMRRDPELKPTTGTLKSAAHRAVESVDPDASRRRREAASDDRSVRVQPLADGMARLTAEGPAEAIQIIYAAISQLADTLTWRPQNTSGDIRDNDNDEDHADDRGDADGRADGEADGCADGEADGPGGDRADGDTADDDGRSDKRGHDDRQGDSHRADDADRPGGANTDDHSGRSCRSYAHGHAGPGDVNTDDHAERSRDGDEHAGAGGGGAAFCRPDLDVGQASLAYAPRRDWLAATTGARLPDWFGQVHNPKCRFSAGRARFDSLRLLAEAALADPEGMLITHHRGSAPATSVNITIPLDVLLGLRDDPAELAAHGPLPAAVARMLATDATLRRIITDPLTGVTLDTSTTAYRATPAMRRLLAKMHETCTFPGCSVPADRCDSEHADPWPHGQTSIMNSHNACRRHHRIKTHQPGWHVHRDPDTLRIEWTSPTGYTGHTYPEGYQFPPPEQGADRTPHDGHDCAITEGQIDLIIAGWPDPAQQRPLTADREPGQIFDPFDADYLTWFRHVTQLMPEPNRPTWSSYPDDPPF